MRRTVLKAAAVLGLSFSLPASAGDCPGAVTAAAVKAEPGATVSACKKEVEDGKTQYEVKLQETGGRKISLDVSPDGVVLLTEEHVAVADVPPAVMAAFGAKYAGAKPTGAEKQTAAGGNVTYELAFTAGTKKREATFAADGSFVEEE